MFSHGRTQSVEEEDEGGDRGGVMRARYRDDGMVDGREREEEIPWTSKSDSRWGDGRRRLEHLWAMSISVLYEIVHGCFMHAVDVVSVLDMRRALLGRRGIRSLVGKERAASGSAYRDLDDENAEEYDGDEGVSERTRESFWLKPSGGISGEEGVNGFEGEGTAQERDITDAELSKLLPQIQKRLFVLRARGAFSDDERETDDRDAGQGRGRRRRNGDEKVCSRLSSLCQREGGGGRMRSSSFRERFGSDRDHHGDLSLSLSSLYGQSMKRKRKKYTLILDLDETLVHSTLEPPLSFSSLSTSYPLPPTANLSDLYDYRLDLYNSSSHSFRTFYIRQRPYLSLFLQKTSAHYELVVFTASLARYADPVIDLIDRNRVISRRYYREHCSVGTDGRIRKDISSVHGVDLKKTVFIDNSPVCYELQPDNALPIKAWFDDKNDEELLRFVPFLTAIRKLDDVRSILRCRSIL